MPVRRMLASAAVATATVTGLVAAAEPGSRAGPRPKLVLDAHGPLFDAANLLPGGRVAACATVRNAGDGRGRPALTASEARGALAAHLRLTVTRGTSDAAGNGSCAGFVADGRRLGAGEPGVVFRGRLDAFPASAEAAVLDPGVWEPGDARAYRFALELDDDAAAEGLAARWDWRLAVATLEAPSSASSAPAPGRAPAGACRTVRLAGAAVGGRTRTLAGTVALTPRVRAEILVGVLGAAGEPRLVLTTGLRVRGKTLLLRRWARVRYVLNGRHADVARARPFRVRVPARALRPGRNRVAVRIRPTHGRARTARFSLTASRAGEDGLCAVGA